MAGNRCNQNNVAESYSESIECLPGAPRPLPFQTNFSLKNERGQPCRNWYGQSCLASESTSRIGDSRHGCACAWFSKSGSNGKLTATSPTVARSLCEDTRVI